MGRKGWSVMEVPNGWYEVLRGPRPPSVRWPVAARGQHQHARAQPRPAITKVSCTREKVANNDAVHRPPPVRVSPEAANEAARARVTSLEAVISALGNADGPALKLLQEALSKARKAAQVAPVGERLEACTQFIERAKKRLEKSDLELEKIQAERARLAAELAEGQARLEALRTEAGSAAPTQPPAPMDVGAELKRMQAVIDDLLRERSQWKGSRPVGSPGVVECTMIPMDVGHSWTIGPRAWKP